MAVSRILKTSTLLVLAATAPVVVACEINERRFPSDGPAAEDGGAEPPAPGRADSELAARGPSIGDPATALPGEGPTSADCARDAGPCPAQSPGAALAACPGCLIEGECVGVEAVDESNPCHVCDPARDPIGWSSNDGASCDDGLFCTTDDVCSEGACAGQARECDNGVACDGVSTCDEDADECTPDTNECAAGFVCDVATDTCVTTCDGCLVDGVCLASGSEAAGNPCLVCNPALSTTAFSPAIGKACGAGASLCSQQDTCDGQGNCQPNNLPAGTACGNPASSACDQPDSCDGAGRCLQRLAQNGAQCDDGAACTVADQCQGGRCVGGGSRACGAGQICVEGPNPCQCQGCQIGNTCFAAGAVSPTDPCLVCDPTRSTTAFSESTSASCRRPNGAECTANSQCSSNRCVTHYGDGDGDGFASIEALQSAIQLCAGTNSTVPGFTTVRPVSRATTDCLDTNAIVYPGQTEYFGVPAVGLQPPFDYDCDGAEVDRSNNRISNCADTSIPVCADRGGWSGVVPPCGIQQPNMAGINGAIQPCQVGSTPDSCVLAPGGPVSGRFCK